MKANEPHSDTLLRFKRPAPRIPRWAGRIMSGTAFGVWALLVIHLSSLDTSRPFTRHRIQRNDESRMRMKSCLLESEPEYRKYCEASTGELIATEINPLDIATNILLSALLTLCLVIVLLFSTINIFLYKLVNKGSPTATAAAFILSMSSMSALGCLFYAGIVPEATATALVFQIAAVFSLLFALRATRKSSNRDNPDCNAYPQIQNQSASLGKAAY